MSRIVLSLGTAALVVISIANASAKDKLSETFLKKAIKGNFAEVSMGDLAQKNGQSDTRLQRDLRRYIEFRQHHGP